MLCTGLLQQEYEPLFFPLLDESPTPSVRSLQKWIQAAWDNGYDELGRKELRNKIIGTNKWIGTADPNFSTLLGFKTKNPVGAAAVIQWMVNYFTPELNSEHEKTFVPDPPIFATTAMPVILQHRGHSRVIVGYQEDVNGIIDLLTFDTGRLLPQGIRNFARSPYNLAAPDDATEGIETMRTVSQASDQQQVDSQKRQITLMELLTPSETELAKGHTPSFERSRHGTERSTRVKIMSHLKVKLPKKDKTPDGFHSKELHQKEPDPRQVLKAFRLTPQQLAAHVEYQVLYVPQRPPLTEAEKNARKVVKCERITSNSNFLES
ncbi:Zinc finger with UFM1-specific peptidase domain protein [Leucoagaricus sp. SymC.cos]|nr:Zinc finger with UFM1-specific peptidase domain protein [Leucoagaricus sp. SymC.cos]